MKRPFCVFVLAALHFFMGLSACAGGALLMTDPTGSLIHMQKGWLENSPFNNYMLPGIILLTANGLFPLFTLVGLLLRPNWKWANALNIYQHLYWAWTYSLYTGIVIIVWITVQLIMTSYFWLQPVIIFCGLAIIICTMLPSVIRYFTINNNYKK